MEGQFKKNVTGNDSSKTVIYIVTITIVLSIVYLVVAYLNERSSTFLDKSEPEVTNDAKSIKQEILNNIYSHLKSKSLTDSDFNTWDNNFNGSQEVRRNIYTYLRNNSLTDSDYEQWESNTYSGTTFSNTNYSTTERINVFQEGDESTEPTDIADMSCLEILDTVMDNGDLLSDLYDSDMNSSTLDYIALYEYEGLYYLIVEFTSSGKKYVYCDINYSDWNDFVDNDEKSYGTSFNRHLGYSNCNCD